MVEKPYRSTHFDVEERKRVNLERERERERERGRGSVLEKEGRGEIVGQNERK